MLTLSATDADEDRRLLYTIHTAMNINSTDYFKIDSTSGTLVIAKPIDREAIHQHILTVMVKDQGALDKGSLLLLRVKSLFQSFCWSVCQRLTFLEARD